MKKAFIFDMDGVMVDSERTWDEFGEPFQLKLFGKKIREKVGDTRGLTVDAVYDKAVRFGFLMNKTDYVKAFDEEMVLIYSKSEIAKGLENLADKLLKLGFQLGLVSSSRKNWIDLVLPRLKFASKIECIISINDTPNLRSKPFPDGYIEAMKRLQVLPKETIILEDSNFGIQSGKSAGGFVIGFSGLLTPGSKQKGADLYAASMDEVIKIVERVYPL